MPTFLRAIRSYLPEGQLTNEELCRRNPAWTPEKIETVTGIRVRPVAPNSQTAGDMGFEAARKLLDETGVPRSSIDALLLCTQSPDYFPVVPATACLLQQRLGLPTTCAAFDFNLGCSGYTYGLWMARALIESGSAANVLLITSDTICRNCDPADMGTTVNFGDAASATLLTASPEGAIAEVGPTIVGTDGRGAENLIVRGGGSRSPGEPRTLSMNGTEVFSFTLFTVHEAVRALLERVGQSGEQIDWYLFHQANRFLLESLRKKMGIPSSKFPVDIEDTGNTSSASIPLLIDRQRRRGSFSGGQQAVLAGFGVGYSWGVTHLRFTAEV